MDNHKDNHTIVYFQNIKDNYKELNLKKFNNFNKFDKLVDNRIAEMNAKNKLKRDDILELLYTLCSNTSPDAHIMVESLINEFYDKELIYLTEQDDLVDEFKNDILTVFLNSSHKKIVNDIRDIYIKYETGDDDDIIESVKQITRMILSKYSLTEQMLGGTRRSSRSRTSSSPQTRTRRSSRSRTSSSPQTRTRRSSSPSKISKNNFKATVYTTGIKTKKKLQFLEFLDDHIQSDNSGDFRLKKIIRCPEEGDSEKVKKLFAKHKGHFYLKQYIERLYNIKNLDRGKHLDTIGTDDNIIHNLKGVPVGAIEFHNRRGPSGIDYGGIRPTFYELLSHDLVENYFTDKNIKKAKDNTFYNMYKSQNIDAVANYKIAGAILAKMLTCDNGLFKNDKKKLQYKHGKLITPTINISRYLVERLMGNNFESWVDMFACYKMDYPQEYKLNVNTVLTEPISYYDIPDYIGNPDTDVTEANLYGYVYTTICDRYETDVHEETENFVKGFKLMIPNKKICSAKNECVNANGLHNLFKMKIYSYSDYYKYTKDNLNVAYDDVANDITESQVVLINEAFKKSIEKLYDEDRNFINKLMNFWTGSPRLPHANEPELTIIFNRHDAGSLPISHTCFNQIEIPIYERHGKNSLLYVVMDKLKTAVYNTENDFLAGGSLN